MLGLNKTSKESKLLLYDFTFLPAQVLALALSTFQRRCSITWAAVSANLHV